ncbi:hypothetical protein PsYK624_136520 [Phanerochaete sordida]|uniref:Uncharacterized protein n=1 Tax=Phanerochaete sordida TaxID=48140 RepID=A0A9P3GM19_9APHY|nr:hypothetical protein PsYK624_136520 [Phanerochaete sordida]
MTARLPCRRRPRLRANQLEDRRLSVEPRILRHFLQSQSRYSEIRRRSPSWTARARDSVAHPWPRPRATFLCAKLVLCVLALVCIAHSRHQGKTVSIVCVIKDKMRYK